METKATDIAIHSSNKSFSPVLIMAVLAILAFVIIAPTARAADVIPDKSTAHAATDTTPPSDVENVKAVSGDGFADLSWNVATDDTAVKGYRIYYGTKPVLVDGDTYELGPIDVGNKIAYRVSGLTNGSTYYFTVTAYDEAGNESENYSAEVNVTPAHSAADTAAPTVVSAVAVYKYSVKVVFSEAITLPSVAPESAFSIKNDVTQIALNVEDAKMDTTDSSNKTVILTTEDQQSGINYIVTAGIQIRDAAGNPIVSGTSDTALFVGTEEVPPVETQQATQQETQTGDITPPELIGVTVTDSTHITVLFSESVQLSIDPIQNFIITEEQSIENMLDVTAVTSNIDGTTVTITTTPQYAMNYNLIAVDIRDMVGNPIDVENNATVFLGKAGTVIETVVETQEEITQQSTQASSATDVTAPADAGNLSATLIGKMIVRLVWIASVNDSEDLANYVLYKGTDGQTYGAGVVIDPTTLTYDISDLVPGIKYFFKLASRDASGNESAGVVASITLPSTGPELGLLLFSSLGLGKFLSGKKRRAKNKLVA